MIKNSINLYNFIIIKNLYDIYRFKINLKIFLLINLMD
jgi:hypothetical protein